MFQCRQPALLLPLLVDQPTCVCILFWKVCHNAAKQCVKYLVGVYIPRPTSAVKLSVRLRLGLVCFVGCNPGDLGIVGPRGGNIPFVTSSKCQGLPLPFMLLIFERADDKQSLKAMAFSAKAYDMSGQHGAVVPREGGGEGGGEVVR